MYLFAFVCPEADDSSRMVGRLFCYVFLQIAVGYRSFVSERLVELDDKVVLEVFGNSAAVACSVADNLVFFRDYFNIRTFVEGIYDYIRMVIFGECETEKYGTFRRCHLGDYIVFCQVYFVVVRSCHFSFM